VGLISLLLIVLDLFVALLDVALVPLDAMALSNRNALVDLLYLVLTFMELFC
jgi:hypothetical protein